MKLFNRLIALLLALLMLVPASFAAKEEASPIEILAEKLISAQAEFSAAQSALEAAEESLAGLEKQYEKSPDDAALQDRLIDAMILQEESAEAFAEANAALLVLRAEQTRLMADADCEELTAEYRGKYAELLVTVSVDENMVIYGLEAEVDGGERDRLVAGNDYLYAFLGKDLPLSIGDKQTDDVAPLPQAQQTSRDLVAALNSLVYTPEEEPAGPITDPQGIADYLFEHGELPENFITKKEAQALGWDSRKNYVGDVAPGKSIGGDRFGNYEGLLPNKKGRTWYEADCCYTGGKRNAHRILYSSDGLVYYTDDHYESFTQMFPSK